MEKKLHILFLLLLASCYVKGQSQVNAPLDQANTRGVYYSYNSIILSPGFSTQPGESFHAYIQSAPLTPCVPLATAPSTDRNYIITWTPRQAGFTEASQLGTARSCEVMADIQYFDGLGRPLQTIQVKGSPEADKDIVQPYAYDQFGRETIKYLPYASGSNNGSYKADALTAGAGVFSFYNPSGSSGSQLGNGIPRIEHPYAETVFEPSPLNRVQEQGAPGSPWQPHKSSISGSGHTVRTAYGTNLPAEVRQYHAGVDPTVSYQRNLQLTGTGYYLPNQLYKTTIKDENWQEGQAFPKAGTTEEFKDKEGRVVLKRSYNIIKNSNHEDELQTLSTHYVYDDFGSLSYVLPPGSNADAALPSSALQDRYCYQYRYDHRKRLIEKKIPGKGWEYLVYNKLDQVVLQQDANMVHGEWMYTKYDALGRVLVTGIFTDVTHNTRQSQQTLVDQEREGSSPHPLWEVRSTSSGTGYTDEAYPRGVSGYRLISYYDDYTYPGAATVASAHSHSQRSRGLQTGARVYTTEGTASYLSASYYDEKGRVAETVSENQVGGKDIVSNTWSFTGELLTGTRTHTGNSQATTITDSYGYDHVGRKKQVRQSINGATPATLSEYSYNDIGQMQEKKHHENLHTTAYTYNPRGWLKSQSSPVFGMELKYEDGTVPQYNGNISNQVYTNGDSQQIFNYSYDRLNRLLIGEVGPTVLSERLSYDVMGNITTLSRDGGVAGLYSYTGNQLDNITDGPLATGNYQYDANGNAITDGRNGMTLQYNYLNLPKSASKAGVSLNYVYDATGNKLSKISTIGSTTTARHYVKGIEYEGNTIDIIHTEEGIARRNGTTYSYEYNLKDHLGNVRATIYRNPVTGQMEVIQRDDYYAFGKRKVVSGGDNKYLYNGKELQEELGGQYDYGARFYDPVIGRWNVIDAKSEKYYRHSPYNYAINNPIIFIDPDGNDIFNINQETGEMERIKTKGKTHSYYLVGADGDKTFVGKFKYNKDGLIQLPSSFSAKDGQGNAFGFEVKAGNEYRAYIRGDAMGSLLGALASTGTSDLTVNGFSLSDGSSPSPSTSHKDGKNGDLRYLRTDESGGPVLLGQKQLDMDRQNDLNAALKKFGWNDLVSERFKPYGSSQSTLLDNATSGKERGIKSSHYDHLHLQGYSPRIKTSYYGGELQSVTVSPQRNK